MKTVIASRYALSISVACALLAACGGLQPPIGAPGASSSQLARPLNAYRSLYSFQMNPDGRWPEARIIPFNGAFFGTTSAGGGSSCAYAHGCGTVFKVTPAGTETVLHRFRLRPDGLIPLAELIAFNGKLYGTTHIGGASCDTADGCGTVFSIMPSGGERVLYEFKGKPDGSQPKGPLTSVNGILYGTTSSGGDKCYHFKHGCGTVYSIDAAGKEKVLYRFKGQPSDGAGPTGNLVYLNGMLYGTTMYGGPVGFGAVFSVSRSGSERVLYAPSGKSSEIVGPSGLVVMDGALYGSSSEGGSRYYGTVYAVTTKGKERIVYSFSQGGPEAGRPLGKLIAVSGLLYGTTTYGGNGSGMIFSLSPSGQLNIVYRFKAAPDGAYPYSGVFNANGTLYGTTYAGGTGCHYYCSPAYGTVFSFSL